MFKSLFKKNKKNKKLYKVVYKTGYGVYGDKGTLLIPGNTPAEAIETFYKKINNVKDILEFTEITYGSDVKKEETQ